MRVGSGATWDNGSSPRARARSSIQSKKKYEHKWRRRSCRRCFAPRPETGGKTAGPTMTKVYLVGAGPGDPDLITIKGRRALESADAVLFDHLAPAALLDLAPAHAERLY